MIPSTREELKQYCLRKLGHPVIQINVADEQLEDRIDEALQYFSEYHFDGVQKTYLQHELTQTDIDNEYITLSNDVLSVVRMYPISSANSLGMFDIRYQMRLNDFYNFSSSMISYYDQVKRHMNLIQMVLQGEPTIRFNRHMNKLYIDCDWSTQFNEGDYLVGETYVMLSPTTYTDIYNNLFLKRYCVALFKQQWGQNLSKYDNFQLPGGQTFNGSQILQQATDELRQIEDDMETKYSEPVDFMVGG